MKVLGLDLGEKTLGIALSDELMMVATGKENFRFEEKNYQQALKKVQEYIDNEEIKEIALGLPLNMNGSESEHSFLAREFKKIIEESRDVKVVLVDERWTTKQANRFLLEADLSRKKRKKVIDKMAAVCILETYLQMRK